MGKEDHLLEGLLIIRPPMMNCFVIHRAAKNTMLLREVFALVYLKTIFFEHWKAL